MKSKMASQQWQGLNLQLTLRPCMRSFNLSTFTDVDPMLSAHVRILLAMAINPLDCIVNKKSLPLFDSDPYLPSARNTSHQALSLLRAWLHNNPLGVLRALPGHKSCSPAESGNPGDPSYRHVAIVDQPKAPEASTKASSSATKGKGKKSKGKGRASDVSMLASDSGDDGVGENAPVHVAGRRIGDAENVWALLGNRVTARRKSLLEADGDDRLSSAGWALLEILVEAWESDGGRQGDKAELEPGMLASLTYHRGAQLDCVEMGTIPWSPELLRQFELSDAGPPRKHTSAVLDMILRPFQPEEDGGADDKVDVPIHERRKLCGRLVGLVSEVYAV